MKKNTVLLLLSLFILLSFVIVERTFKPVRKNLVLKPQVAFEKVKEIKEPTRIIDRFGEKIEYDVLLGNIRIGEASFVNRAKVDMDNKKVNLVVFQTKLANFFDVETIYCDSETFLPLRIEREVLTWPKKEKIVEEYDQEAFSLVVTKLGSRQNKKMNFKKDSPIHNAVILPYYVRQAQELSPGWKMKVNLPTNIFEVMLLGLEELRLSSQTIKAYHFQSDPKKFEFWVSADEKRIPLKIKGTQGYILQMKRYSYDGE